MVRKSSAGMTSNFATSQDVQSLAQRMAGQFDAFESRVALTLEGMESRIVFKLGAWMTVHLGLAVTLLVLFR